MKQQENKFNYTNLLSLGVYETTLPDFNVEGLISLVYELEDYDKGMKISNKGGYHSSNFVENPKFFPLIKLINSYTHNLYNKVTINVKDIWANISSFTNFNLPHNHSLSNTDPHQISGVLYLKTPPNSGSITFLHPLSFTPPHTIIPKPLQFIIFPSVLIHYVEPNLSQEDRISIAFNFVNI